MVQITEWLYKTKAVKNVKPSQFKNHQSSHSATVANLNSLAGSFVFFFKLVKISLII